MESSKPVGGLTVSVPWYSTNPAPLKLAGSHATGHVHTATWGGGRRKREEGRGMSERRKREEGEREKGEKERGRKREELKSEALGSWVATSFHSSLSILLSLFICTCTVHHTSMDTV